MRVSSESPSPTTASASILASRSGYSRSSNAFTHARKPREQGSASLCAGRSSSAMAGGSGLSPSPVEAPPSTSRFGQPRQLQKQLAADDQALGSLNQGRHLRESSGPGNRHPARRRQPRGRAVNARGAQRGQGHQSPTLGQGRGGSGGLPAPERRRRWASAAGLGFARSQPSADVGT